MNDDTDPLVLSEDLGLRLLRFRHYGFNSGADVDNHLPSLEALDETVDKFTNAADIVFVNHVTLGFTYLLENDLLGSLGGDPTQILHRAGQLEHITDLRAFAHLGVRLVDRHLLR